MKWLPKMTLTLLQHLDDNAGDRGWNNPDKGYLYEDAAQLISKQHPQFPVSEKQVRHKIGRLKRSNLRRSLGQPLDSIYQFGRNAVLESYLDQLYEEAGMIKTNKSSELSQTKKPSHDRIVKAKGRPKRSQAVTIHDAQRMTALRERKQVKRTSDSAKRSANEPMYVIKPFPAKAFEINHGAS